MEADLRERFLSGETERPSVKVCCIGSTLEADLAIGAGADALGFVSAMPSGPGPIPEADIAAIVRHVAARVATVLLTSRQDAAGIARQLDLIQPTVVQLVDALADHQYEELRASHPCVALMQVIHVRDAESVREAVHVAQFLDAILLDSGNPSAAVKELGGTGRVHDWGISRRIRDAVGLPVFLAGGLRPANVADAIDAVNPYGVDVCSGVRSGGALDPGVLHEFMNAARGRAMRDAGR